jgi:hypothetical protein
LRDRLRPDRALDGVIIEFDATIVKEALEVDVVYAANREQRRDGCPSSPPPSLPTKIAFFLTISGSRWPARRCCVDLDPAIYNEALQLTRIFCAMFPSAMALQCCVSQAKG